MFIIREGFVDVLRSIAGLIIGLCTPTAAAAVKCGEYLFDLGLTVRTIVLFRMGLIGLDLRVTIVLIARIQSSLGILSAVV